MWYVDCVHDQPNFLLLWLKVFIRSSPVSKGYEFHRQIYNLNGLLLMVERKMTSEKNRIIL